MRHGFWTAYTLLRLQVYLQQGRDPVSGVAGEEAGPDSGRWTEVAKLLSRKHDRMDPLHALSLLPDGVSRVVAVCPVVLSLGPGSQRTCRCWPYCWRSKACPARSRLW